MILYVNKGELEALKLILDEGIAEHNDPKLVDNLIEIKDRIYICELLAKELIEK